MYQSIPSLTIPPGDPRGMIKETFRAAKYSKVAKAVFQKSGGHMPPSPPDPTSLNKIFTGQCLSQLVDGSSQGIITLF